MAITATLLFTTFLALIATRPRLGFRRAAASANAGCGETTAILSYDRLRLVRIDGHRRLRRCRRNFMIAGYGWSDPTVEPRPENS